MSTSVIICTYNRSHNLPDCISSLAAQQDHSDLDWEVVIVDNNSTDDTRRVALDIAKTFPVALRYVFESSQGLSHARNRGIQETDGEYLIFIDDDIRVTPFWIRSIHDTFESFSCDAVGGPIFLEKSLRLPAWVTAHPEMRGFLGQLYLGDDVCRLDGKGRSPFGGNMAIRRKAVEGVGLFDTGLGRKGAGQKREDLFKGEEADYFARLAAWGGSIYYQPGAAVTHKILPFQLKKNYFRKIHFNSGFLFGRRDRNNYSRSLIGIPLYLLPQTLSQFGSLFSQVVNAGPAYAFRQEMIVSYFVGMMYGYFEKAKSARQV